MTSELEADPGTDLRRYALTGDPTALEAALRAALPRAWSQARRLLRSDADAEDAVQEALLQLARTAHAYDGAVPFGAWLGRLVQVACRHVLRGARRRQQREARAMQPSEIITVESAVDSELVREVVRSLPEVYRDAIELHYFAGLNPGEVAQALGISENTCGVRLHRAREKLRTLLQNRGVTAAGMAILAALTAPPASAAPLSLTASVPVLVAQAAAGTLPATSLSLTTMLKVKLFMTAHPLACSASIVILFTGFTLVGLRGFSAAEVVEHPSVAPAPVAPAPVAIVAWSAPAQALLPYLDPAASFRLAIDGETLRPALLQAKPLSMLNDAQMAPLIQAAREAINALSSKKERFWFIVWQTMAEQGRALTLSLRDRTQGDRREDRLLAVIDAGRGADGIANALPSQPKGNAAHAPIGSFSCIDIEDRSLFIGRDGERFAVATIPWLTARINAPPAPQPSAAAWFHMDAGPLVARYAALAGPAADPANVAAVLGAQWRTLRPVIEGTIGTKGDDIISAVLVTKAASFSPLVPLTLLLGGSVDLPFRQFAACPMRAPTIAVPISTDGIVSLSLGLALPASVQPFTKATTEWRRSTPTMAQDLMFAMLDRAWSGDLALEIRPGVPLPRGALALGLRPGTNPVEAVRQIAVFLGAPQEPLDQPGPLPKAVTGMTAVGQFIITAFADRLVVTWNAAVADWPGIATAAAPATSPACAAMVDLPAAVRAWWPLVMMVAPAELRTLLPPQAVLIAHLPVWNLQWAATPDGCRIDERGLPLATILTAAAAIRSVEEADPERESQQNQELLLPQPAATNEF